MADRSKHPKHIIQKAIEDPGYLHRALGIPQDQDIPKSKIEAAAHQTKNPHLEHAAEFALRLEAMHGGGKKKGK